MYSLSVSVCPYLCEAACVFMLSVCEWLHVCSDCIMLSWSNLVSCGGGCSCMLLLHPVPTSTDAGPELCTLCPDLCHLDSDLCTLCLWCIPSFYWCKHSTCTGGSCHQLQLAMVVLFHAATGANTALALCGGGLWYIYIYIYIIHEALSVVC